MSINTSGFKDGLGFDGAGLRKPNEGAFQAVLPSGLPIPHKATDEVVTYDLVLSDGVSVGAVEVLALEQEHNLSAFDAASVSIAESVDLSEESALEVTDSVSVSAADSVGLIQEHDLISVEDGAQASIADELTLSIDGATIEHVLDVSDGAQASAAETVALSVQAVATVFKRRRYYAQIPEHKKEEKPKKHVHVLSVNDAAVYCDADEVGVSENQILSVSGAAATFAYAKASVIRLEQKRRRRFVQEDEILLMAA